MQKIIAIIHQKDGISREEFLRRWQVEHPAYVRRLPGLRRYVQNPAIEHATTWPADGGAELWFDSLRDIAAAFEGPAADELRAHEEHFIGKIDWFVATETEVSVGEVV
jgi:uncharacterized protein (TIGR02118 family)